MSTQSINRFSWFVAGAVSWIQSAVKTCGAARVAMRSLDIRDRNYGVFRRRFYESKGASDIYI